MKEGDIELLSEIARFEESVDTEREYKIGWSWRHVKIWPATLSRLFKEGYLDNVFRSNSYTGYLLSELGKAVVSRKEPESDERPQGRKLEIPDGIFADIVGHDNRFEIVVQAQGSKGSEGFVLRLMTRDRVFAFLDPNMATAGDRTTPTAIRFFEQRVHRFITDLGNVWKIE